jgi:acetoin:2,6-dichlorophenolindophenol oxidoreductase subunit alpha
MIANDTLLDLYRLMQVTRTLDRVLGAHSGHWHGLEGEEATVAAVYHGLRPTDTVAAHYRGAVSASYAKGADLRRLLAGCLGKATSYHMGRHRSDVCGPPEFNVIGLYSGSLGPPLGYATGAAMAARLDGRDDVAIAVFGDGTSSRGDCHEAMNLAGVMALPIVFVCQNNQYAISTPAAGGVGGQVWERAKGFGMPGVRVDGNDVLAVHEAMSEAIARARAGKGPSLVECLTFRVAGHFHSDQEDYRDQQEVDAWRRRDPVEAFRALLLQRSIATLNEVQAIEAEVQAEVEAAWRQALADPDPAASDFDPAHVYA